MSFKRFYVITFYVWNYNELRKRFLKYSLFIVKRNIILLSKKEFNDFQYILMLNSYMITNSSWKFFCVCVCNKVLLKYEGDREDF